VPAELKPEWLERLRRSVPGADLRFNYVVHRWEFILPSADGVMRSQFWGRFYITKADGTRDYLPPNEVTGLHDFRDLDDAAMEEACENLERTFIGNRYDGVRGTREEVLRRMEYNAEHKRKKYKAAGELWADMFVDRLPRMRGTQQVAVLDDVTKKRGLVDRHGEPVNRQPKAVQLFDAQGKPLASTPATRQERKRANRLKRRTA
jgi:hypothetical protein